MENEVLEKLEALNLNKGLFNLIDSTALTGSDKWELLTFAYEFVVNGKLINISKHNDSAIDKLYPICREIRKSKTKYLNNGLVEIA